MVIHADTQERVVSETTSGAGSTSREGSVGSDSLLASLFVSDVTSGSLAVSVYTLTDTGREVLIFSFPVLTSGTTNLLLKKAGVSMSRFRVAATYTGVCSYEVYVRAINGVGQASAAIQGANSLSTSSASVGAVPVVLISSSLTDRQGLVIKNWSTAGNLFLSEDQNKLPASAWPLGPKDALALDIAAGVSIYAISDSGVLDIRIAQAGG